MSATLTIRDETLAGQTVNEWSLDFLTERVSVRELIRGRVYQEVQDYNLKQLTVGGEFSGRIGAQELRASLGSQGLFTFGIDGEPF